MMTTFRLILLIGLIVCAAATALTKKPMQAVIIYMAYSVIMSVIWIMLESPDLAITEAAVGAGITSLLLFLTLRRLNLIDRDEEHRKQEEESLRQHAAREAARGGSAAQGQIEAMMIAETARVEAALTRLAGWKGTPTSRWPSLPGVSRSSTRNATTCSAIPTSPKTTVSASALPKPLVALVQIVVKAIAPCPRNTAAREMPALTERSS